MWYTQKLNYKIIQIFLRCDVPTKFKFLSLIRIQISDQANSLADSVMCVKAGRNKGGRRYIIPQKKFKSKKDKVFKWIR